MIKGWWVHELDGAQAPTQVNQGFDLESGLT